MPHLTEKQEKRYGDLFRKLDYNSDGRIDVNDLIVAFEKNGMRHCSDSDHNLTKAKKFILKGDKDSSGNLSFSEFAQYMIEHENKLELVFKAIDTDTDNKIGTQELIGFFEKLGVDMSPNEANILVEKINRNGTLRIESDEWKNYFLLTPIDDIDDLLYQWQHSTLIDIGENFTLPPLFPDKHINEGNWWKTFISGAVAGMISRTTTAPFDRLKTVMQAVGSRKHITIRSGFQHMLNEGGISSLWRGNGVNVIKVAPEAALKFMFYEEIKSLLIRDTNEPTIVQRFFAGSIAGGLAQSLIYPLEVLKTRLVLRKTGEFRNVWDCIAKIRQREGLAAFYKGFVPNFLGIIPYAGVDLAVYETLKHLYMKKNNTNENPPIPVLLLCGSTSTITGQLFSYPLALIRTRLQAQEVPMDSSERDTMTKLIRRIWKYEGVRGLYRGILPNVMKVVPAVSISYVVYESMKKALIRTKQTEE